MTGYDVAITRLPIRALFELTGALPDGIDFLPDPPSRPNTFARRGEHLLIHSGPARWMLMAPIDQETALERTLEAQAVLLSDTLTFFTVTGPDAAEVMAVATPLDVHTEAFPPDAACFSEAFGTKALVRRVADGFEIGIDQSYADWFAGMLDRAAS